MNTYSIQGSDRNTGEDRTITLQAPDEIAAAIDADNNGLIVSETLLISSDSPIYETEGGNERDTSTRIPAPSAPEYKNIVSGNDSLEIVAVFAMFFAIISFAVAFVGFAIWAGTRNANEAAICIGLAVAGLVNGMACTFVCVFANFVGSVGLAVRDVARNSFLIANQSPAAK